MEREKDVVEKLNKIWGAIESIVGLHKDLSVVLEAEHKLFEASLRKVQQRITIVLLCSAIAIAIGVISISLQLLQLLKS